MRMTLVVAQTVDVFVLLAAVGLRAQDEGRGAGSLGSRCTPRSGPFLVRRTQLQLRWLAPAATLILGRTAGDCKSAPFPVAKLSLDRSCAGRCFGVTPSPLWTSPLWEATLSIQVASGRLTKPWRGPVVPCAVQQGAHVCLASPCHVHHQHSAFSLLPDNALEGDTGSGLTGPQTIGLGDGSHRRAQHAAVFSLYTGTCRHNLCRTARALHLYRSLCCISSSSSSGSFLWCWQGRRARRHAATFLWG